MAEKLGNPGALGLSAFGVTTLCMMLLNTSVFGIKSGDGMAMVLGIGIFFGGLVQFIAGWQEWKCGNTFGAVAFTSYGAFWLSFCFMNLFKADGWALQGKAAGIYMLAWTLFTVLMFIASLKIVPILRLIFGTATIGFTLLTIADFIGGYGGDGSGVVIAAGVVGTILALEALYGGVAQVINETWGYEKFPIGVEYMKRKAQ